MINWEAGEIGSPHCNILMNELVENLVTITYIFLPFQIIFLAVKMINIQLMFIERLVYDPLSHWKPMNARSYFT